jgi:hypothetical protein
LTQAHKIVDLQRFSEISFGATLLHFTAADGQFVVSDKDVRVERSGGNFTVDLTMYAPVAPSLALSRAH